MTANFCVPHITLPTRITPTSSTSIDNIYSNSINFSSGISGNLMSAISDHFPQFLILPKEIANLSKKHNLFKRDTKNFDRDILFLISLILTGPPSAQLSKMILIIHLIDLI